MHPDACENCGLETDELEDLEKPEGFIHWFICKYCKGNYINMNFILGPISKIYVLIVEKNLNTTSIVD